MNVVFDHVSKYFGNVQALRDVSITIPDGELFFLLGPSGCGKTTLLRCLGGFETPSAGRIQLGNEDVTELPPHLRNTAMVFQGYALWPHMTVYENVSFGLTVRHVADAEREKRVAQALRAVQIQDLAQRRPGELSGGQQQRVALARTLVVEPGCLLLDEPLANLDAKLRRDMRSEIRRICKNNGLTAVYVTHDRQEALSMADRIAVMRGGSVLQIGSPHEIYQRPVDTFVASFMGETNFIPGTVKHVEPGLAVVDTLFGEFGSSAPGKGLARGQAVSLSLRPEAIQRGTDLQNTFRGKVETTTYMGELSEHSVRIHDSLSVKMYEINVRGRVEPGAELELHVDPEDVVVLPAGDAGNS